MNPESKPGTPEFVFIHLMEKMDEDLPENPVVKNPNAPKTRLERFDLLWRYLEGNAPLPRVADDYRSAFEQVLRKARANYQLLIVESMVDRSKVGNVSTAADADFDGDEAAAQIHDMSSFPAFMSDLQTHLYTFGESYARILMPEELLGEGESEAPVYTDGTPPMFVAEDPRNCVGWDNPRRPGQMQAWVKIWDDELYDQQVAVMYWDSQQFIARREEGTYTDNFDPEEWEWSKGIPGEKPKTPMPQLKPFGGVPVVKFRNKMDMGEFEPHIDILDRIIDSTLLIMVIGWYQSFRQRAIKGNLDSGENLVDADQINSIIKDVRDGETGELKDLFQADPGALWLVPGDVDFWESQVTDLQPLSGTRNDHIRELSAVSRTPLAMFAHDDANQTSQGSEMQQKYHVDKIKDRQARITPGLILLHQMAFAMMGDLQRAVGVQVKWSNATHVALADKASATQQTSGVLSRKRQLVEIWGWDAATIKLNETELMQEALMAQSLMAEAPEDNPDEGGGSSEPSDDGGS
ncbi:portal protein [Gordonia phage Yvonnetastic]|uniref:Portal protein n=1 Tax=Gordonia phage Yvonnetastic TaxID=1821566 RepID=A0A142K8Z0_9CAUD|nr:portal protein [Gordonia phage Yvonnetastic]AMS02573.1 portal protein [Gordonia phage Yvonnetastic]